MIFSSFTPLARPDTSPQAVSQSSGATCATSQPVHALPSESLLRGHKIVEILHNGSLYKLQATKLGKLILTK